MCQDLNATQRVSLHVDNSMITLTLTLQYIIGYPVRLLSPDLPPTPLPTWWAYKDRIIGTSVRRSRSTLVKFRSCSNSTKGGIWCSSLYHCNRFWGFEALWERGHYTKVLVTWRDVIDYIELEIHLWGEI